MDETIRLRLTNGTDERGNLRFVDVKARRPRAEKRREFLCPVCGGPIWAPQIECGYHRGERR